MINDAQKPRFIGTRRLTCPRCQCAAMRRVKRHGFLEQKVYPLFGYYPWECGKCRIVKLFRNRGARRVRIHHRVEAPSE